MRDSDPEVTFEADTEASEGFLNWSVLQLERCAMDQCTPEQNAMTLPRNKLRANQGMSDCNHKGTPGSDQKAIESLLCRSTLQLKRGEMDQDQHMQEQQKESEPRASLLLDGKPVGRRSTRRRRGCAEANGILNHGRPMQGSWAF
ncbi:hypothetical protein PR202_gb07553 [Eleusine coracana subsp. coracana]|uniref:Uncharacterized protein n=1 Tax=Eleusine coracana subsp. coracana TaxID=191504 RepID=A0AAV5ECJ8_ELECO|nr:hypothetical protein PR202_gb07553 [Eleusine coracana subsp. coracana]